MVKESVMKGLESMFQTNTRETVKMLSAKYGFDLGEALADLDITETVKVVKGKQGKQEQAGEKKEKKEKKVEEKKAKKVKMVVPKMVLPYCGRVVEEWCEGVKKNHGLYSQCTGEKNGEGKYCKACKKQAEANESGEPTLGNINERMEGPKRVTYAVVMKKLKIEKEEACAEAKKFGLEIPLEEFEMPASSRGRPKKVSESESVSSDEGEKKRRGRPKKNKTVAANTTDETDDLIASLVAEANALKSASEADASACETDAEEAEVDDSACETDACETDADSEAEEASAAEEVDEILLKKIHEKINADKKFKKMSKMVVEKKERKKHLLAVGEYIKTLLTEEELALYNGPPEEVDIYGSEDEEEAEEEAEACEPVEDEATRKAREAAEKKAQVELEKQQKKEQADQEKKAKAQEKAQAAAEKKAQADLEKQQQAKQKKEQAEQEKKAKQQAAAEKKAQAELEKKQAKPVEAKEKKVAKKKEAKPVEAKPVEAKPEEVKPEEVKPEEKKEKKEKKAKEEKKAQVKQAEEVKPAEVKPAEVKPAEVKPAEVKPVEKKVEEELLAEAVAEEAVAEEAPEEAVAEETVTAKVFEYEGKKYLKTEEGILYDQATEECVGVWNEETKSIDEFADEED